MKYRLLLIISLVLFSSVSLSGQGKETGYLYTSVSLSDCFTGSYTSDNILFLFATDEFSSLNVEKKEEIINTYFSYSAEKQIITLTSPQKRELWIKKDGKYLFVEKWDNNDMQIMDYTPISLQRNGESRWYFNYGGTLAGARGVFHVLGNFRAGTYLFKNILDVSAAVTAGLSTNISNTQFIGNLSLSSRAYLPLQLKAISLSPYAGAGVSMAISPDRYIEPQFLAGICWLLGPGNLDFGVQYGIRSKWGFTIGYTFRPSFKSKR